MVSKWWVVCAALFTLLAGCIDDAPGADPDPDPAPVNDGDDGDDGDGNQTAPPTNAAPTATLEASALNGTAPLNVTFTLGGSDPDGDDLTWSLTVGNDTQAGDALPATVNATLEVGNHTVTLTVSDGNLTGNATLVIAVEAGAATGPAVEPILGVFEMIEGCELCVDGANPAFSGAEGCVGWHLGENELDCAWMEIPDGYQGQPYSVFSYTSGTIPLFGTDGHPDVDFYDDCASGATLVERHWDQSDDKVVGVIPDGAKCLVAFEFHWPNLGHTIEVSLGQAIHG